MDEEDGWRWRAGWTRAGAPARSSKAMKFGGYVYGVWCMVYSTESMGRME